MAFFSFSLLIDSFLYLSTIIEPNKKYYSKDIALSTKMNFAGLKKAEDRANLILFMRNQSDNPVPLPK